MNLRYYSLNNGEQPQLFRAYGSLLTQVFGERAGRIPAAGPPAGGNCNAIAPDSGAPAAGQPGYPGRQKKQDSSQVFL